MTVFKIEYDYNEPAGFATYATKRGIKLVKTKNKPNAATVLIKFMETKTPKLLKGLRWSIVGHLTNRRRAVAVIHAPVNSSMEVHEIVVERIN